MYKISNFYKSSRNLYYFGKTLGILLSLVIVFLIIFNITLMVKSIINPNKLPDFLGLKTFVIVSESMEPTINPGDAIFIKEVPQNELKENDIISFKDGNIINTHRIVRINNDNGKITYTTKGDNNKNEDRIAVSYDKIEGKYEFKLSKVGILIEIIKSKATLVILLVILMLISYYQVRISKRKLKRKEERYNYNNKKLQESIKKVNKRK